MKPAIKFRIQFAILVVAAVFTREICFAEPDQRSPIVETLLAPLGPATGPEVYGPDTSSPDYQQMAQRLRSRDHKVLQSLMDEVTNVGVLEKSQPLGLSGTFAYRVYRVSEAFQIAGTNANSLFPALKEGFLSGTSVYASEGGLLAVGGDAWPALLEGLTNSNPRVRVASIASMRLAVGTNAIHAFPYLSRVATNYSSNSSSVSDEASLFRLAAAQSLCGLAVESQVKLPILIHIANAEPDNSIRCIAILAIGKLGTYNDEVRELLRLASEDQNEKIRLAASTARKALD
jgi:hypothetical protein